MTEPASPHVAELCCNRLLAQTEDYIRREPVKAAAIAFGVGLLLNFVPARAVVRPVAGVTASLLPPALLGLGLIKAFELCSEHCHTKPAAQPVPAPAPSPVPPFPQMSGGL